MCAKRDDASWGWPRTKMPVNEHQNIAKEGSWSFLVWLLDPLPDVAFEDEVRKGSVEALGHMVDVWSTCALLSIGVTFHYVNNATPLVGISHMRFYEHRKVTHHSCKLPDLQFCPVHPVEQLHVSGSTHSPPFRHPPVQMAGWKEHKRESDPKQLKLAGATETGSYVNKYYNQYCS